jgi:hypothetical protein
MDLTITKCMDDADVPDVRLKITTYQKPHHQYISQSFTGVEFLKASSRLSYSVMLSPTPCLQIFCT